MPSYQTYTDEQLLERLRNGEEAAFAEIYRRYKDPLSVYALRITRNTEEAIDLVQEIFVSFWKRREVLDINYSLNAYFYKSVRNVCARYIEKNIKQQRFLDGLAYAVNQENAYYVTPAAILENTQTLQQLSIVIDQMPEKMKIIYKMSREEQLTHKEISERLNIAESTVKKHVQNALKIIKSEIPKHSIVFLLVASIRCMLH